jgi:hypothetical protein
MNESNHDLEHSPDMEDALKVLFQSPVPNEAFVDRLEQQLRDRAALSERGRGQRSTLCLRLNSLRRFDMHWQRSRAVIYDAIGLAALLILLWA